MPSEPDVLVIDAYRLDDEEIAVDFSDGTSTTFKVQELLEFRATRTDSGGSESQ